MAGQLDIRVTFIIPKQDVIAGIQVFNQVIFQYQRFTFCARVDDLYRLNMTHHGLRLWGKAGFAKIARQAFFQVLGFTYIDHLTLFINHAIDTRLIIYRFQKSLCIKSLRVFCVFVYHACAVTSCCLFKNLAVAAVFIERRSDAIGSVIRPDADPTVRIRPCPALPQYELNQPRYAHPVCRADVIDRY